MIGRTLHLKYKLLYLKLFLAFVFFSTLVITLIFPNTIGIADNGDFIKTISTLGLSHLSGVQREDLYFNFVSTVYETSQSHEFPHTVSQLFIYISLFLNNIFSTDGFYSIFYLTIIYITFYTITFFIFLHTIFNLENISLAMKAFVSIVVMFVLSDSAFISYFNSFYQEAISIVFLFMFVAYSLREKKSFVLLFSILLMLSIVKVQNIVFVLLFIFVVLLNYKTLKKTVVLFFSMLFILSSLWSVSQSSSNKIPNTFNSLFYGLLKYTDKETSTKILKEFDLGEDTYLNLVAQGYWPKGAVLYEKDPAKIEKLLKNVNHFTIMQTYIKYPSILLKNIYYGLKELSYTKMQLDYLGNYTKQDSQNNTKTIASSFVGTYLPLSFMYIYLVSMVLSIYIAKNKTTSTMTDLEKTIVQLTLISPFVFGLNMLGDGFFEFVRHNLSLYFTMALLLVLNLVYLLVLNQRSSSVS